MLHAIVAYLLIQSYYVLVCLSTSNYTARKLAAAQCIVIGPVCGFVTTGGRAVSEPCYNQRAQCLRLSERFIHCIYVRCLFLIICIMLWLFLLRIKMY